MKPLFVLHIDEILNTTSYSTIYFLSLLLIPLEIENKKYLNSLKMSFNKFYI